MQHVFQLPETTECTCTHVNIREENHGDEKVLAVDLAFQIEGPNDLLDLFHPDLRVGLAGAALQDVLTRGKLVGLKGQKAFIRLVPPATLQVVKGGKGQKPGTQSDGKDAGDIFAEQHGGGEDQQAA